MVMWGLGEDEMKGRHGLLTTYINETHFGAIKLDANVVGTLPETDSFAPENKPSQKEIHLPTTNFPVRPVSFRKG